MLEFWLLCRFRHLRGFQPFARFEPITRFEPLALLPLQVYSRYDKFVHSRCAERPTSFCALSSFLQLSVACLYFLQAIWLKADLLASKLELMKQYSREDSIFSSLVKVLKKHAHTKPPKEAKDGSACAAYGALFAFLAGALDFLCLSTDYALRCENSSTRSLFFKMWRVDAKQLIEMPHYFLLIDCCEALEFNPRVLSSGSSKIVVSRPGKQMGLFPVTAVSDFSSIFFNVDVTSIAATLGSLRERSFGGEDLTRNIAQMALSRHLFLCKSLLLRQWHRFVNTLLTVAK
jgi:hypothetical protein